MNIESNNEKALEEMGGAFVESLKRNNKQIRTERALVIAESAELKFKRKIEDLGMELKQLRRDRENMLDLSPTSADSLVLASDFNSDSFVERDLELGVKIRNLEIKFGIAQARYNYLFGNNKEINTNDKLNRS